MPESVVPSFRVLFTGPIEHLVPTTVRGPCLPPLVDKVYASQAVEGNDFEGQNQPRIDCGQMRGYGEENSVKTPNESVEVMGDDENGHHGDYDLVEDKAENVDVELENEAFDDSLIDDIAANEDFMAKDPNKFCEAYIGTMTKVDIVENNICKHCSCKEWDLTGIPCHHVFACVNYMRQDPIDYVDKVYSKDT
ncbi:hypothetical protein GH714_008948 [Hevea brasiliensis]|uniref:SWIM-type domain-containing protein n=1 Tax=Hevea brasiliensis TaxID=3981 RepID=A0A6A6LS14_HEVBR|nr:hypothetical protein GH714_008948 [Hevea brasiliensis]